MIEPSEKRALVTGAGQGLGKALTGQLLADGWHVTSVDVLPGENNDDVDHQQLQHDLSDRDSVDALLDHLNGEPGFDLVILNAALQR